MSARAGIVVTGTEVLTGRVSDRNGTWLAETLRRKGVDVSEVVVVGDRPEDMLGALAYVASTSDLVITTGGLGPTADDLTAQLVADFQQRPLEFDEALHERIAAVVERLVKRFGWNTPAEELLAGTRKQALVPHGAHVLEPTGTAPGLVVPREPPDGPPVLVLPGPPGNCSECGQRPKQTASSRLPSPPAPRSSSARCGFGGRPKPNWRPPMREHEHTHGSLPAAGLEVSTCLRGGELEIVTRLSPDALGAYDAFAASIADRFGDQLYSRDEEVVEDIVADLLRSAGDTVATAESCTGGLLAGRLTDLPGSSDYVLGGFVTYSNEAKADVLDVSRDDLARVGAVSEEVAIAMAHGARRRLGATYGLSTTGIAGPDGGTPEKPVGLVHVCVAWEGGQLHARLLLGGSRDDVRQRTITRVLHLLRETLLTQQVPAT